MNKNIKILGVSLAAPAVAAAIIGGAYLGFGTHIVPGAPVANRDQVVQVHEEQAEAAAKAADDAAKADLADIENTALQSLQGYYADPANGYADDHIFVSEVQLIAGAPQQYDGMVTMSADGGPQHQVPVHVTADSQTVLWTIKGGALAPLFP